MNISEHFEHRLKAPLRSVRKSWGAVRKDGTVFLRVWRDEQVQIGGFPYVCILKQSPVKTAGYSERLEHIEQIMNGAPCYMVMCVRKPEPPNEIVSFNKKAVFKGGEVIQVGGDYFIHRTESIGL